MSKSIWVKTVVLCAALLAAAGTPAGAQSLKEEIDGILASSNLAGAVFSLRLVEVPRGRVLYSFNCDEALSVASNAKIVTTAAALDLLGAEFELSTTLVANGAVKNGTLYGDLVIIGRGDPSISEHWNGSDVMAPLRRFAQEAAASGIKKVAGDLVANDLYFDRQFLCPSWPPDQWIHWYEAPVGALAFNDNCVDVAIGPGPKDGAPAVIRLYPPIGYMGFTNRVRTTSSVKKHRSRGYGFYRGKFDNNVTAKGYYYLKAPAAQTNFTVYDPSMYMAAALSKALSDAGVEVQGRLTRMLPGDVPTLEGARVVAVNRVGLVEVVKHCNLNSQNLYAEMILKTLGREVEGEGSFEGGARAVGRFLEKLGVKPGEYTLVDGSGLSRETKFSTRALTEILKHMYTHETAEAFRDSLPLSGYAGSLANRLDEPACRGKIRAKTGWIMGASALSGYARTANDKTVAFSMLFNSFKGSNRRIIKPIQDEICRAIVRSSP